MSVLVIIVHINTHIIFLHMLDPLCVQLRAREQDIRAEMINARQEARAHAEKLRST